MRDSGTVDIEAIVPMAMMEKKFDEMDKSKKGILSADDVMRSYGRSDKGQ